MRKGIVISSMVLSFAFGGVIGVFGSYYFNITRPQQVAMSQAKKQADEINKMSRHGTVLYVKPDQLTVLVEKSGDPAYQGKTVTLATDYKTVIQEGGKLLSNPSGNSNMAVDLTTCLKPGMTINILAHGDKAMDIEMREK